MRNELTQRERDDMRDLLLAGAQRIRPFNWDSLVVSAAVTVFVVAAVSVGVVAVLNGSGVMHREVVGAPITPSPTISPDPTPAISPGPTPTRPPASCVPVDFPDTSLPQALLPSPPARLNLQLDPCLTVYSLLGSYGWLEDQGIDADLIQGFQGVAKIEPWVAPLSDGSGSCIIIRAEDHNGFGEVACDAPGAPATIERTLGTSVMRFVIENDAVVLYVSKL